MLFALLLGMGLLSGCASTPIERDRDPFESPNRFFYTVNDTLDKNFVMPVAKTLRENKIRNLEKDCPVLIATANIGCYQFLKQGTELPVIHWIELLDPGN